MNRLPVLSAHGKAPDSLFWRQIGVAAFLTAMAASSQAGWVAYNDCASKSTQVNAPNVTTFGLGRNFEGEGTTGKLRSFSTGDETTVTVTFEEHISTGSVNSAGDAATYASDTDAEAIFGSKVDLAGNISYGDSPGWYVDMTLTGLDPARKYTFVGTANRNGGSGYADRVTNWKLMGADKATYASSPGARKVADDSVEFSTGENGVGYVARWTDIKPGADGTIVIRTSHTVGEANGGLPGAHAYKGYGGGVFLVAEQVEGWEAYNDSAFKDGQTEAANTTTIGIGRNFTGEGLTGNLKSLAAGDDTLVTATYEEHISTGSVNNAGDAATYTTGTDASEVFNGKVDIAGNISYGDSPGWWIDLTITGLDPTKRYTFAGTANRNGGAGYADRVTNWQLRSAVSATYASSTGAKRVSDTSVEFSTGENGAGYIARWTDIAPGSDGRIVIRTTHTVGEAAGGLPGAHAYKGYGGGVFMLKMQPSSPYRWLAYNDSAFKDGQVEADNVTTFGIGRNFTGEANSGILKNQETGDPTTVTATYEEHISTGSVNNAGDAAAFVAGTDAATLFEGTVDLAGNISYGDSPGWWVDLTFTGLDPAKFYTFAGTADRHGGSGYADRVTNWKLIGADSFAYGSSAGARKVTEDSVEFSTGENGAGYVAKWTDIKPGSDGKVTIRTSHTVGEAAGGLPGAHAYKGYGGGVFLLGEQYASTAGQGGKPVDISSLLPADGATNVHPNTPIMVSLKNGDHAVKAASIQLKLDGGTVTPVITTDAGTTTVTFQPATMLASDTAHTVILSFTDDAAAPKAYSKQWSFRTLDYSGFPTLPSALADTFSSARYKDRGFRFDIAAPDPNDGITINTIDEALAVFDMTFNSVIDPSILNADGEYIEHTTINYQIDGNPIGNKAGDRKFPGIEGSGQPGEQFALKAYALLHLKPGYYRMNITMQPGFKLWVGSETNGTELIFTFTPCTNCGGDDGPWFTDFLVSKEGVYPFELLFYNEGGNASLEWVTIAPTTARYLVNDDAADAVQSYLPPTAAPLPATLSVTRNGATLQVSWTNGGTLQSASIVTGPWADVSSASPQSVNTTDVRKFFRVRQ